MSELDGLIEDLRRAYAAADRNTPGPFRFVAEVKTTCNDCFLALVLAVDSPGARQAAAKMLTT